MLPIVAGGDDLPERLGPAERDHAAGRQPAELIGEHHQRENADKERRRRMKKERGDDGGLLHAAAAPPAGDRADESAEHDADDERGHDHQQRVARLLEEDRGDRLVLEERLAEIEQQHVAEVARVLHRDRIVEAPQRALAFDHLDREIAVDEDRGGIAGQQLEQREDDREDRPHHEEHQDKTARDVTGKSGHRSAASPTRLCGVVLAKATAGLRPRQPGTTSSVQTLKLTSVLGPNVVVIATSIASRPLAIKIRPIRGALLRGSNVYQCPPR